MTYLGAEVEDEEAEEEVAPANLPSPELMSSIQASVSEGRPSERPFSPEGGVP